MKRYKSNFNRRTVLRTAASLSLFGLAGCLNGSGETGSGATTANDDSDGQGVLSRVAVEGTALVVELGGGADVERVNLIQPNGELFGKREVAAGARRVSFEIGTAYDPGEYRVLAVQDEDVLAEMSLEIQPELEIVDIGLFRNNPDKPWDEVYGESETNRIKNSEAYVKVRNLGTGPDAIVKLRFSGDVPYLAENYEGSGLYGTDHVVVPPDDQIDLFSTTVPFGPKLGDEGMGCSTDGTQGEFTVVIESTVTGLEITKTFKVTYSGSEEMRDCDIEISAP
ncbi:MULTISPECIES: hypothetical protein [Haloferax]|uniref:Uncharacterized protein n=1 Tax=Haloferax marinum TaxID=2666143 RepID=A0A6A8GAH7_9EURY|nr:MULTISPECIES: hypothetical protein [Haloferax]KAB1198189.1 hypothetical protein Hfx1150_11955 [Haloferax sp. CBA1150]MRW97273.1 hypothetical protein [Haloferax marinum]